VPSAISLGFKPRNWRLASSSPQSFDHSFRTNLAAEDMKLAEFISSGEVVAPPAKTNLPFTKTTAGTTAEHLANLSDGIERMPRRLSDAEGREDRLFLHLQVVSSVLPLLCPTLGAC
jgi:hypothetical protein